MSNILTRKEVEDQFGHLVLNFDFFCGNTFVFSGQDSVGNWITMYVHGSGMTFVGAQSSALITDALQHVAADIRFLILDSNLNIIYED